MVEAYLRQSPLAALGLPGRAQDTAGDAGIAMRERPFRAIVNLRGDAKDPAFSDAVQAAVGFALPREPNSVHRGQDITALWLGPDEWWLVAESDAGALADKLRGARGDMHAAVTEVGEGFTCIHVSGPAAPDLLAKGCPLDFHETVFPPGSCAQGDVAKATVVVHRLEDDAGFEIYVRSSFAEYLWRWLEDAAGEYGVAVVA